MNNVLFRKAKIPNNQIREAHFISPEEMRETIRKLPIFLRIAIDVEEKARGLTRTMLLEEEK